ncbi:methyl-accepting chemotaxis protein [Geminocystis sp. NIES-3708]|uniref:methyl-accepting chemotaxis protein n=1 Tax=Geminocystis sp. NIES-3708 TaxID=1615909 RepID=UPI0005FCCA5C|nr:HAMP domain-containing methyl-accepting chemotaxis protein [Geminocystis sp. NIES-3708]BAQ62842.1 methyl-accepting chemotaxis protein [Geminocystis sp. NIES-3708]
MVSETDYQQRYGQAQTAYLEGDLETANNITDSIIEDYPHDPSVLLLKGHIHLRQQKYEIAKATYEEVLSLTDHQDLVSLAHQGLTQIQEEELDNFYPDEVETPDFEDDIEEIDDDEPNDNWTSSIQFDSIDWDVEDLEEEEIEDPTLQQNAPLNRDFSSPPPKAKSSSPSDNDSFNPFDDDDDDDTAANVVIDFSKNDNQNSEFEPLADNLLEMDIDESDFDGFGNDENDFDANDLQETGTPTFVVSSDEPELSDLEKMLTGGSELLGNFDEDFGDYSSELEPLTSAKKSTSFNTEIDEDDPLVPDGEDNFFFAPDELDDIPDIGADELPVSSIFTKEQRADKSFNNIIDNNDSVFDDDFENEITGSFSFDTDRINLDIEDDEISVSSSLTDISSTPLSVNVTPEVEIPQGNLAQYFDVPLFSKQLVHGGVTGLVTFLVVFFVSMLPATITPQTAEIKNTVTSAQKKENQKPSSTTQPKKETAKPTSKQSVSYPFGSRFFLSLLAGIASGGSTVAMGYLMSNHIKRYTNDLQNQFESVYQGNYEVKATVYSQDEFGTLAAGFNQMAKMINTTTTEARKRAEETERAREDLQRQVIRLLDDVEGAARGDLTVQAEVTADVLGAVADAFNLTITNLRKIVKQVKQAAVQVNKASTDSEVFARNQSSDALRMAEELAVTLNSVQMMTDSIQRVAENAREAEEVARSSSVTALKGGDAVERTVAGILQIRETVSETTRKVKRLAEASQQISTIVAVISQISSRTNLLALNASIQAARAGEAGRGFAIVAEEVRQLADRSAKSLQEIEQIVLQIQTETGSVMTAMEEGIQQVRDVTDRSEQAKRALEDIIQVSNRIDALVRSITADTDEQRENSRGVAKVMQAVELTAQATSQESQRVAGSLQNLVGIAKDLISSVERFKVEGK